MVCHDRSLIGPPLLDDLPSSRSNTTSCAAGANGWLVDACRRDIELSGLPSHGEATATAIRILPLRRSSILRPLCDCLSSHLDSKTEIDSPIAS